MNDEYLWQKTGVDPEIEKLEQKLAVLRYRETPLNFPVAVKAVETAAVPRWRISLAFAFAASVIAAVLVAVLFLGRTDKIDDAVVFVASPELESSSPAPATTDEKKVTPAPAPRVVPQLAHSKRSTIIRTQPVTDRTPKTRDPRPASSVAAFTEEEKFAYRQLMLALSISSSKLKIVQDTINGNENIENTRTNQR